MTDRERAIVTAYTGITMFAGDRLGMFYEYVSELFGRPIYSHEFANKDFNEKLHELSKKDFFSLCEDAQEEDSDNYEKLTPEALASLCRMKDKTNKIFSRRVDAAREVIDAVAIRVGLNPDDCGLWLYAMDGEGDTSPITRRLDEWIGRSGDKAKLKKRVQELEQENEYLKSLFAASMSR